MKSQNTRQPSGFTLLELLIVIGIIAILASVAFPVTGLVIDRARKAEAQNETVSIVRAVKAYEMEYSKYPIEPGSAGTDTYEVQTDQAFMKILLGKDDSTSGLNPRGSIFYEGKAAKEGVAGLLYAEGGDNPSLVDPWGNMYYMQIDGDYNGVVSGPTDCTDTDEIRMSVIAWSKGKPKEGDSGQEFEACKKWPKTW